MAEEKKETPTPTLKEEEGKTLEKTGEGEKPDLDALLNMLEEANATTPEQLEGKLRASREVGQMAQLLGEERNRSKALEEQMREMQQATLKQQRYDTDYQGPLPTEGQPINLEDTMAKVIRKEIAREKAETAQVQANQLARWNKITLDKNYTKVKDIWDEKCKDPGFMYQIQTGVIDPVEAYREVVDEYKDGLLRRTLDTIKQLQGSGRTPAPHVEAGETAPTNLVSGEETEDETAKVLKALEEKTMPKGEQLPGQPLTTEDELAIVDRLLKPRPEKTYRTIPKP